MPTVKPSSIDDADHSSTVKPSFNERAEACEELLSQLKQLDSKDDLELENRIKLDQPIEGNSCNFCNHTNIFEYFDQVSKSILPLYI